MVLAAGGKGNPADVTARPARPDASRRHRGFEAGYTLFDNADIYARGEAEMILGAALKEVSRDARGHSNPDQVRGSARGLS